LPLVNIIFVPALCTIIGVLTNLLFKSLPILGVQLVFNFTFFSVFKEGFKDEIKICS
jgi:hypothetical protein